LSSVILRHAPRSTTNAERVGASVSDRVRRNGRRVVRDARDEENRRSEGLSSSGLGANDHPSVRRGLDVARRRLDGGCILFAVRDAVAGKREFRSTGCSSELRGGRTGWKILSRGARDGRAMGGRLSHLYWSNLRIF
jgi:hypothetical protein